jgi:two-component system NtrC family sensor kinase
VLARKLTMVLSIAVFIAVVILGIVLGQLNIAGIEASKIARLNTLTRAARVAVENMLQTGSLEELRRMALRLASSREVVGLYIVNREGAPMISPGFTPPERLQTAMVADQPAHDLWLKTERWRARIVPVKGAHGEPIGRMAVVQSWADAELIRRGALLRAAASGLLLAAAAAAVLWAAVRIVVAKPVEQVEAAVRAIAEGRMGAESRLDLPQSDELGELARAINWMQDQLEQARSTLLLQYEEKLALERSLHESERLAAVGQLAAGIAHELGTALNIVLGRAQLLIERTKADDKARTDLTTIVDQCDRISRTIRSLLDFSRSHEPRLEPVDLNALITDVLDLARAELKNVEVETEMAAGEIRVPADRQLLEQVLLNLVMNAVHAMDGKGRLAVGTQDEVHLASRTNESFAAVRISDTGVGIDAKNLRSIFEPFYTTKDVGQGTGLGLSISYKIVSDHHGEIEVDSTPGEGTRFTVYLPKAGRQTASPPSESHVA